MRQFSISETQKFGHVTYFFNGNRSGKFSETLEEYVEIPSDTVPFEERPWMKCAEIADRVIEEIESGKWDLIKLNFPNGDMVGHTGVYQAVVCSMEDGPADRTDRKSGSRCRRSVDDHRRSRKRR